jgi:hypothetical protein
MMVLLTRIVLLARETKLSLTPGWTEIRQVVLPYASKPLLPMTIISTRYSIQSLPGTTANPGKPSPLRPLLMRNT